MRIAVVTVCLNAADSIRDTVESVVAAGQSVAQYIVIDGASVDGTVAIVRQAGAALGDRLVVVSEPDEGLYFAMNRSLELVEADLVLFLGADDTLVEGSLAAVEREVDELDGVGLVVGDIEVVGPDGAAHVERGCHPPATVGGIPRSMPVCHQAMLMSPAVLRELGGFDTSYRIAADYDLYLRFRETGWSTLYVPEVIARFALTGRSASSARSTADEYRRVWIAHGVSPAVASVRRLRSVVNLRVARVLGAVSAAFAGGKGRR